MIRFASSCPMRESLVSTQATAMPVALPQSRLLSSKLLLVVACSIAMVSPALVGQEGNVLQKRSLANQDFRLASGYYQKANWADSASAFEDFITRYPNHHKQSEATFFLAESKVQLGQFAAALPGFQKFVEQNPQHRLAPRAMFRLGESAYQLDQKQAALKSLELFVKKNPRHELVEYAMPYLGELRLSFGEPKYAQRAFAAALRLYPQSELTDQNRFGLARSYRQLGKPSIAARYWKFLAEDRHSGYSGQSNLELGILAFEQKDFDEAKPLLAEAIVTLPAEEVEARLKANYWLARVALEQEQYEQANTIFTGLNSLPADADVGAAICYDAAVAAWKTNRNDLAVEWLSKLRSTWPANEIAPRAMALEIELLRQQGLDTVVLDYAKRFMVRFPKDELRFNVAEIAGRTLYKQEKFTLAVKTYENLLAEHSKFHEDDTSAPKLRQQRAAWLYLKGLAHIGQGDFATAIEELRLSEANMIDPDTMPQLKLAIASSLFGQQLYPDAIVNFESYLEHASVAERANVMSALTRLVVCYAKLDRWQDADDVIVVLMEGDRKAGLEAISFVADEAWEKKRFDIALGYYKKLAVPENDAKYRSQGLAGLSWLMMEEDSAEANSVFQRLVAEYPDSKFASRAAISRAKLLEEKGKPELAKAFYQKVVDRFPNFELAQAARLRLAAFYREAGDTNSLRKAKTLTEEFLNVAASSSSEKKGATSQALVAEALYQIAWIDRDLGNKAASNEAFAELVATQSQSKYWPDAAWRLASSLVAAERFAEATTMVEKILARKTVPPEVKIQTLYLQSKIAAATQRWDMVPDLMDRLIASSDSAKVVATAKYWKAESLYRYGDFHAAGLVFDQLQANDAQTDESLEPWILLRLAQCHGKSQRWTNAATIAEDSLDRFADFSNAYEFKFLLGRAAEYDGLFDEARDHYQEIIDAKESATTETAAIAQWRIGEMWFHQNLHREAIAAYEKTALNYRFEKWSSAALIQAGKCQEHLENWSHAKKLYTELLRKHPACEFVADAKERLGHVSRLATVPDAKTQTR